MHATVRGSKEDDLAQGRQDCLVELDTIKYLALHKILDQLVSSNKTNGRRSDETFVISLAP
jgi:hypothetical protein